MGEQVRAKFHCEHVDKDLKEVRLRPVYSGSEENDSFFEATPGGEITMSVTSPRVLEFFVPGKEFYVDFIPAN